MAFKATALLLLLSAQAGDALSGAPSGRHLAFAQANAGGLLKGRSARLCESTSLISPPLALGHSSRRAGGRSKLSMQVSEGDVVTSMFELQNFLTGAVSGQLQHITPISAGVLFVAGVLTSLSPCSLSVLPLTVGYIGGGGGGKDAAVARSIAFAGGLALALSSLGLAAALAGKVYGVLPEPWNSTLPILTSGLFILLGLAQLEVLPLPALLSPTVSAGSSNTLGEMGKAAMFGATSALISTPCGTPVLGAILALVAEQRDPILGLFLLLCYSLGQAAPVFAAGLSTSSLKGISKLQPAIAWVTPASGSLLMIYGTYSALERLTALMG